MFQLAMKYAAEKHADQLYGEAPYMSHIEAVVEVLNKAGFKHLEVMDTMLVLTVAALHDVVEDCGTDPIKELTDIRNEFGEIVAQAVFLVTDPTGSNRKEKKQRLYDQFVEYARNDHISNKYSVNFAALVKCADRVANQEKSIETLNVKKMKMYVGEFPEFISVFGVAILQSYYPESSGYLWNRMFAQYRDMITTLKELA